MAQSIELIVNTFKEHVGGKAALLEEMAGALCSSTMCAGVECRSCPFNDGDALKEHIIELAGELA